MRGQNANPMLIRTCGLSNGLLPARKSGNITQAPKRLCAAMFKVNAATSSGACAVAFAQCKCSDTVAYCAKKSLRTAFPPKSYKILSDTTLATSIHSVGNMSRTDNFRNARCLQAIESTTKRANSHTNRSSFRHLITSVARSVETTLRSGCDESSFRQNALNSLGKDRIANRNRFLGFLHSTH